MKCLCLLILLLDGDERRNNQRHLPCILRLIYLLLLVSSFLCSQTYIRQTWWCWSVQPASSHCLPKIITESQKYKSELNRGPSAKTFWVKCNGSKNSEYVVMWNICKLCLQLFVHQLYLCSICTWLKRFVCQHCICGMLNSPNQIYLTLGLVLLSVSSCTSGVTAGASAIIDFRMKPVPIHSKTLLPWLSQNKASFWGLRSWWGRPLWDFRNSSHASTKSSCDLLADIWKQTLACWGMELKTQRSIQLYL